MCEEEEEDLFAKWIRCRSRVLTRSSSNGIRQREVSLSVVISDY